MALKNKNFKPDLAGHVITNTDDIEFSQNKRINTDFAKGGHMKKISTVFMKEEITTKILSGNNWGTSGGPVRRPLVLNVEAEK
ncbi:MAG: hypothetical protein ACYS9Y_09915 [Planctomycetota bacterium]|jgi:hypothetical protein